MKKLQEYEKSQIYGGISFWSASMGIALLSNVAMQAVGLIRSFIAPNEATNQTWNNQWASNINYQSYQNGAPMMIRFGLTPNKSSIFTTLPNIF